MRNEFDIAKDIVKKSKSPFCDDDTLIKWIAAELIECKKISTDKEHTRIETWIGNASRNQINKMIETARFKHGRILTSKECKEKKQNE